MIKELTDGLRTINSINKKIAEGKSSLSKKLGRS